ncbi:cysteine desulfurase [Malacoplasma iowae]|uniref:Aminotransferase class V-fold PLP-dependent enzyme n=1 Tax=Malacoplasma iowae 695 TaxID=1048830 RepID=A0A6P1LD37_MALIO|nr:aminotransferase class V-fold PLP-dependent enzyme [Malacoplasma iowae]VEU61821.1 Probable cysteine desulfurase [Mycoplasmopsis fermentans]EGZ30850.1 aminotransferase NifS [Malacoplasma iowae 695]QHG90107.1 aminotransferase class V-fold PLP-dependent enzyme [Malacoplasma iowae 695]WPL36154.1 aminotransferase class V-fold PLP-dependent enzyme [Malacoplasma iowae]VEU70971.1 Probable cysteine desulfurase [Malacoplasma iowae]
MENRWRNKIDWFANNSDYVYLDSAATALKPRSVLEAINYYTNHICTNPHNDDSQFSHRPHIVMEETRTLLSEILNCDSKEIIFTPGGTFSLNMAASSLEDFLSSGDEIILTNAEHASNILPWMDLAKKKNLKLIFAETDFSNSNIYENDIINKITHKTKVVAFANGTNLIGHEIDAERLSNLIKSINNNIFIIVDAVQYLAHNKMNLKKASIDFLACSAHKMMGPTGIGALYINKNLINFIKPKIVGGGMNGEIRRDYYTLMEGNLKFEAGTPNIMGIYGWNAALKLYVNTDFEKERERIFELKHYLDSKLKSINNLKIYNMGINSFVTIFSIDNVFSQDLANYLGNNKIIVRSGLSCAKLADEIINYPHVVRVSMHFYTTKEDIDKLIDALKKYKKGDELDGLV